MEDDEDAWLLAAAEQTEALHRASQLAGVRAGVSQAHWPGSRWEDRGFDTISRTLDPRDGPPRLESWWSCRSCDVTNPRGSPCSRCGADRTVRVGLRLTGAGAEEEQPASAVRAPPPVAAPPANAQPPAPPPAAPPPCLPEEADPAEAEPPLPPLDADGLAPCPGCTEGMRFDPLAARSFVFPAQTEQRQYQLDIVKCACGRRERGAPPGLNTEL